MTTFLLYADLVITLTVTEHEHEHEHEHHERATVWLTSVARFAVCPVVEGALIRFLLRIGESMETAAAVRRRRVV